MSRLEHVACCREQILVEVDSPLEHVFFPDSGVVSLMAVYSDGGTIEMATIGKEGCARVQAVFGTSKSSARYWVQIPGSATKISRAAADELTDPDSKRRMLRIATDYEELARRAEKRLAGKNPK